MNRNSLLEMSGRAMHVIQRFTLNKGNDNPMMQELTLDGMNSEGRKFVERVQAFGMTTMPLPRDEKQQQRGGSGGGTGGNGEQMKGPAAEGICVYIGGQRNHPVCIGVDDRRHRPMG
ncbi:phage baseplate assembly protein [Bradyrhizobium barranii subsp. apii]|uniref:phage baseplate assembly protein domain-containing protein n=1 Tax=Bradyrhizobium barranii TaxID=2992140 RepID=UPI001AA1BD4D|nr:phage baseplate assembly protein [Bradyrhizobium barranii]UPT99206.1 phage baseplate assembly protein [Bradyrhizobium barranii subsp. apii]